MPYLPFIMYAIAAAGLFFLAGINYMSTDHLIDRERIEQLAGEYVALTMGLESYRAENGAFPQGPDWRTRIAIYAPGRNLPPEEGSWTYSTVSGGYSLCFATRAETVLHATFLCPQPGASDTSTGSVTGPGA